MCCHSSLWDLINLIDCCGKIYVEKIFKYWWQINIKNRNLKMNKTDAGSDATGSMPVLKTHQK